MNEIQETTAKLAAAMAALFITYDIDTSRGIGKRVLELQNELCNQIKEIR